MALAGGDILVYDGSQDRTREIAREHGARVYEIAWPDSFAEARNQSLDLARGQWIFWMDADDVHGPRVRRALRRADPPASAAGRGVPRSGPRYPPGPGEFSEAVVDHVKLFPNRPELRFEHRIHEQILPAIRVPAWKSSSATSM